MHIMYDIVKENTKIIIGKRVVGIISKDTYYLIKGLIKGNISFTCYPDVDRISIDIYSTLIKTNEDIRAIIEQGK